MYRRPRGGCPYCYHPNPEAKPALACKCQCHGKPKPKGLPSRAVEDKRLHVAALAAYGGVCACCGETRLVLLSIDHIAGNGAADRRYANRTGNNLWRRLAKDGYPEGFQVLCRNCNWRKGVGPACDCRTNTLTVAEAQTLTPLEVYVRVDNLHKHTVQ